MRQPSRGPDTRSDLGNRRGGSRCADVCGAVFASVFRVSPFHVGFWSVACWESQHSSNLASLGGVSGKDALAWSVRGLFTFVWPYVRPTRHSTLCAFRLNQLHLFLRFGNDEAFYEQSGY